MTVIRTPNKAHGGITEDERAKMAETSALWIKRAVRTEPIEVNKIVPAIKGLYAAAGLKAPRVVIVPSPLVMTWEQCAIHGGFRVLHPEFCIVSDFPEFIKVDRANRPHCENGPSHRWRDGWSLYHWHGVVIPAEWVTGLPPSAKEALTWENIEQRRAACEIIGWNKILKELDAKTINADGDEEIGTLIEVEIPDSGKERFLCVKCGTGRKFAIPVPKECETALEANLWTYNLPADIDYLPEVRT